MTTQPTQPTFQSFATWAEVIAHVAAGRPIYYQGPMDWRPWFVRAIGPTAKQTIRVRPISGDVDPFTADHKHLDRFRFLVEV